MTNKAKNWQGMIAPLKWNKSNAGQSWYANTPLGTFWIFERHVDTFIWEVPWSIQLESPTLAHAKARVRKAMLKKLAPLFHVRKKDPQRNQPGKPKRPED